MRGVSPIRTAVLVLFTTAAIYGVVSSSASYERLQFYTHVEPDISLAESYEVELWFKVPATLAAVIAALAAAAPLFRRYSG